MEIENQSENIQPNDFISVNEDSNHDNVTNDVYKDVNTNITTINTLHKRKLVRKKIKGINIFTVFAIIILIIAIITVILFLKQHPKKNNTSDFLFANPAIVVESGGKLGAINANGEEIVPTVYDALEVYKYNIIANKDNESIVFDKDGKEIFRTEEYTIISEFNNNCFLIKKEVSDNEKTDSVYKYGVIDKSGNEFVPCTYDNILNTVDYSNLVSVKINDKWGYINKNTGIIAITPQFDSTSNFNEVGIAIVKNGKKYGLIDENGTYIANLIYYQIEQITNEYYWCYIDEKKEKSVIIDKTGKNILKLDSGEVEGFVDNKYFIIEDEHLYVLDKDGNYIIKPLYDNIIEYPSKATFGNEQYSLVNNGLICVKKDDTYGYINIKDEEIIPFSYEEAYAYSNGNAIVKLGEKYGLIDTKGNYIVNPQYESLEKPFHNDYLRCRIDGKYGVIDKKGRDILQPIYDSIRPWGDNYIVSIGEKYGIIDSKGNEIVPYIYDNTSVGFDDGYIVLLDSNQKLLLMNKDASILTKKNYDRIYNLRHCAKTGCTELINSSSTYCYDHKPKENSSSYSYYKFCKFPRCYSRATILGYCYYHFYLLYY